MHEAGTILVINPGSTSTKLSVFYLNGDLRSATIPHSAEELAPFASVAAQREYRLGLVTDFLGDEKPAAVIGRGGLLAPLSGGVYRVNERMLADLESARYGEHASNLGAVLARAVAGRTGAKAFIADPVVVDELDDISRYSGLPEIERRSIFHALNQKSAARTAAAELGREYEELNLIVAHLGGGVSVGAHRRGRVVDVNNALDGEGPFSPERSGGLPAGQLLDLAAEYRDDEKALRRLLVGRGGLVAYLGTNDLREVRRRIEAGDEDARLAFDALALQIAKEIASHGATLAGEVDAIILTGGMAHNDELTGEIRRRVAHIAPVHLVPGEREMEALAENAREALAGRRPVQEYAP